MKTPHEVADEQISLAAEYSKLSENMAVLQAHYITYFNQNRDSYKSDKRCDNAWRATPEGMAYHTMEARQKAIDRELRAGSKFLRNAENEARNLY